MVVIRYPSERRNKRNTIIRNERDRREWTLLTISFIGLGVIPGAYVLTGFPRSLNQGFSPTGPGSGLRFSSARSCCSAPRTRHSDGTGR